MEHSLKSLEKALAGRIENLVLLHATDSTHAMARRLVSSVDAEGVDLGSTLIISNRQDKGEGRGERTWISPAGGLYLSWLLPNLGTESILLLPMLAAIAARDAISSLGVSGVRIKWPNDILVDDHKIAGILIFARHGEPSWVAVSLGVNLTSAPEIPESTGLPSTSLAEHINVGQPEESRHSLVVAFVENFERHLENPAPAMKKWRDELLQSPGDHLSVRLASGKTISGTLIDLSSEGFLRIRHDNGETVVTGGDIIES